MNPKLRRMMRRRLAEEKKNKYSIEDLMKDGVSKGKEPEDLDPNELEMGIEVEMEHTGNKDIARKIALDHLSEVENYYSLLKKMEVEAREEADRVQSESRMALKHYKFFSEIKHLVRKIMEEN